MSDVNTIASYALSLDSKNLTLPGLKAEDSSSLVTIQQLIPNGSDRTGYSGLALPS